MNIFYLSDDPSECARWHVDRHVVKMIVEYAQLMSTAHRVLDGKMTVVPRINKKGKIVKRKVYVLDKHDSLLYKATHMNHPSAIWVRQSRDNYETLYKLWIALIDEWRDRFGHSKFHKCETLKEALSTPPKNIPDIGPTKLLLAMPDEYQISNDPIECYRNFYSFGKAHLAKWKNRDVPQWYNQNSIKT